MAYSPRPDDTGSIPRIAKRAVIHIPGYDLHLEQRRTLLHCDQRGYDIVGITIGELRWRGAIQMYHKRQADVIVTVSNANHTREPGVEVAGAGRTSIRTPATADRLRTIASLVDSGLSVGEIVRIMRTK